MRSIALAVSMLILPAGACGGGGGTDPDAAPSVDADPSLPVNAEVALTELFLVIGDGDKSSPFVDWRSSESRVALSNAPLPAQRTVAMTVGACELTTYEPVSCDPACGGGEVCEPGGTCAPLPANLSVGTLTFTGLTAAATMEAPYSFGLELPEDAFADDADVTASAPGDEWDGFEVTARGVPEIRTPVVDATVTVPRGTDHSFTWTPSGDASARVRLELKSNNVGHGTPLPAIITCEAMDSDGEIVVDAALLDPFPTTQRWNGPCPQADCPESTLTRYHRSLAPFEGGVLALEVRSVHAFGLAHEGP